MKNLIVSIDNLPDEVKSHLTESFPHGYYHKTFEFEIPGRNEIYEALRTQFNGINYMIKLSSRKKNIDKRLDL